MTFKTVIITDVIFQKTTKIIHFGNEKCFIVKFLIIYGEFNIGNE